MLSKPIFKQTVKANYKLWLIFTFVMCVMSSIIIAVYDPKMASSIMNMVKDLPIAEIVGDKLEGMNSLIGMLGESFYSMQGIILSLVFVTITANGLIASQVDRGSMAYLLSTPTKRSTVVRTQAAYLVSSVLGMFLILSFVGLCAVQFFHGGIISPAYTDDVKAVARLWGEDEDLVAGNLGRILQDEDALAEGAKAREIDTGLYALYLNMKVANEAYEAAAQVLDVDVEAVAANPGLIKENEKALVAAAEVYGVEPMVYGAMLDQVVAQAAAQKQQQDAIQEQFMKGLTAAAGVLDMEAADLAIDLGQMKDNSGAMEAATSASGLPPGVFVAIIDRQLAGDQIVLDEGVSFVMEDFLAMNLGIFLLMFATSGISFLFSCVFNLSKNSTALGAGIPMAFYLFQVMSHVSDNLEGFKYLTINTLFDPTVIVSGGNYWPQFAILGVMGIVLYMIGMRVFETKDLPL